MSLAVLYSRALSGIDAPPVTVEVHLANCLPNFTIVGLPAARQRKLARQEMPNFLLSTLEIDTHCAVDDVANQLLKQAISKLDLSARAYHRILKVARTIADLAGVANINTPHIAEAIQYRRFDKN